MDEVELVKLVEGVVSDAHGHRDRHDGQRLAYTAMFPAETWTEREAELANIRLREEFPDGRVRILLAKAVHFPLARPHGFIPVSTTLRMTTLELPFRDGTTMYWEGM